MDEGRSISSGEDGHWGALSDRLLVPVADQLLVHIARSVDSFIFLYITPFVVCDGKLNLRKKRS